MCDQHGINEHQAAVQRREIIDNLPVDTSTLEWPLVGCSVIHEEMIMIAAKYAQVPEAVYLYGEAGVGKQTLARLIHELATQNNQSSSPAVPVEADRRSRVENPDNKDNSLSGLRTSQSDNKSLDAQEHDRTAFCHIDCADTPTSILRAFIFNAYQQPNSGSIYLSAIDQIPLSLQEEVAALMVRSLREGVPRFFLSSCTLSLQDMDEDKIHPSLLLHLLQYPLELPPLHKRAEDIPVLLEFYVQKNGATLNLSDAELQELQSKEWPENIRELKRFIAH